MKDAYAKDDQISQFPPERCGWRTRVQIAQGLSLPMKSFYGKNAGEFSSEIQYLVANHKLEVKYFDGERGRGGEIMRFRLLLQRQLDGRIKQVEDRRIVAQKVELVPTGVRDLDRILGGGYAERSTVMLNGPKGIGKGALGYLFLEKGI